MAGRSTSMYGIRPVSNVARKAKNAPTATWIDTAGHPSTWYATTHRQLRGNAAMAGLVNDVAVKSLHSRFHCVVFLITVFVKIIS